MIAGFMGNTIDLYRLLDDGSGFKTEELPKLLTSSADVFRPVDVGVGPDGAIYVADWFNKVIGHYQASYRDPQRDRTHGRIWRITHREHAPVKQPNLASMKPGELLEQLRSPERWTRAQAKRVLFDSPSRPVTAAADQWVSALDPTAPDYEHLLLEVIGVFEAHETARPELLAKLLAAKDARVRAYGTRVVGNWATQLPDPLGHLRTSVRDESPRVRLEAVVASSYVEKPQAIEVATAALEKPQDRFIEYALGLATHALQPLWAPALAAGKLDLGSDSTRAEYLRKSRAQLLPSLRRGKLSTRRSVSTAIKPMAAGYREIYPPLAEANG